MTRTTGGSHSAIGVPVFLVILASLASACGGPDDREELPVLWEAPEFALVDQTGDTLRAGELEGTAWVAHFFFTNCEGVCPMTTARMKELRGSKGSVETPPPGGGTHRGLSRVSIRARNRGAIRIIHRWSRS